MAFAIKQQMAAMRPFGSTTLRATARIKLDMSVCDLSEDDWSFFGDSSGVRMLFVDMKEPMTVPVKPKATVKTVNMASKKALSLVDSIIFRRSCILLSFCFGSLKAVFLLSYNNNTTTTNKRTLIYSSLKSM